MMPVRVHNSRGICSHKNHTAQTLAVFTITSITDRKLPPQGSCRNKNTQHIDSHHKQQQYFIPSLDALSVVVRKINQNLSNWYDCNAHIFFPAYMSFELCKTESEHDLNIYLVERRRCNFRPKRFAEFSGISLDDA